MINENQENMYPANNILNVVVGMIVGALVGAVTMLLLAPQSGKDTRMQIQKKGFELRDRTADRLEDTVAQVRSSVNKLASDGREKIKEIKQYGQDMAVEQLDHVSEAAQAGKKAIKSS
ncbi:MAG: YtxH domain-containing protein [Anaerolineales bacterium]|nr:YtxH domain-containing protein [Anaerolineales bacterium]